VRGGLHAGARQQQRIGWGQRQTGMNSTFIPTFYAPQRAAANLSAGFKQRRAGPITFPAIPEKNLFNRDKSSKLPESLNN